MTSTLTLCLGMPGQLLVLLAVGGVPYACCCPVVEEHVRGGGREEVLRRRRSRKGRASCKREIMMLSMNCVIAEEFKRCQD